MSAVSSIAKKWPAAWGECLFLGLLVGALMALNVPAQWTGIATDPEFTAWVAPLSNRLAAGQRLYDFGGHMPLPPLSSVVLYWLSAGHATWLTESFWNQAAIMGSLVMIFLCLRRVLPARVALLGAIAALATYSACNVVLFYNSLANFLTAALACAALGYARRAATRRVWPWLAGMAFSGIAALLAKQNVGGLALVGAALVVLGLSEITWSARLRHLALFVLFSAVALALLCLVISPWVSLSGMVQDVFLTGSQCKGGTGEIVLKLLNYLAELAGLLFLAGLGLLICRGSLRWLGLPPRPETGEGKLFAFGVISTALLCALGLACGYALSRLQLELLPNLFATEEIGLAICLVVTLALIGLAVKKNWPGLFALNPAARAFAVLTLTLLPAAAGYSLSTPIGVRGFYWYVHIAPLIQVALTAVAWLAFAGAEQLPAKSARWAAGAFVIFFIAQNWQPWRVHWAEIKNCTDTWPGVEWFAHARVTQNARPLEALVADVRNLTRAGDTVLLLPDDPNLEECFDRPRPALNCAIIFTDQYWPRYVADDFARLQRDPPKVILIGPRDHWRDYSRLRNNTAAVESLIDRIQTQLLPARYQLAKAQPISYNGGTDYLDVWVRKD